DAIDQAAIFGGHRFDFRYHAFAHAEDIQVRRNGDRFPASVAKPIEESSFKLLEAGPLEAQLAESNRSAGLRRAGNGRGAEMRVENKFAVRFGPPHGVFQFAVFALPTPGEAFA